MSGECDRCGAHCLECTCKPRKPTLVAAAKAAAARLSTLSGSEHPADILEDVADLLAHYNKLTKPKVSRKGLYLKGRAYEYEARDDFIAAGLKCRRVPGSGSGEEKGDLRLITGFGEEYKGEAKRYASIPSYLTQALDQGHDFTVFREDRGQSYVLVTFKRFTELCQ